MRYLSDARFGAVAQFFHWLTAILVVVAFIYGPGGPEEHIYSAGNDFDRQLHETLGLSVFFLTVLRLLWRFIDRQPAPPPMPHWMHIASKAVQGLLYLLLFAVPLTAISGAWLEGHDLTLLGATKIPAMIAASHDTGETIAEIHGWLGDVILWLAGAHAAAAIYHHVMLKDTVLVAMLPRWLKK
jgi:cytochrome b561